MRPHRLGSLIVIAGFLAAACAVGSRASDRRDATSSATATVAFEKPPPGQSEGQPPAGMQTAEPGARPPAASAPEAASPEDGGKSAPLPPGFFDAGSTAPIGKATVRDAGPV